MWCITCGAHLNGFIKLKYMYNLSSNSYKDMKYDSAQYFGAFTKYTIHKYFLIGDDNIYEAKINKLF